MMAKLQLPFAIKLSPRVKKWLPWVYVPVGYIFCFCVFAYWAFPYDRLEQRIVMGYNASQKSNPEPKRMVIGDLTWSWRFPGVVMSDVELIGPKPAPPADGSKAPPRQHIHIDEVYAGVAPLAMLFGTTAVDFSIEGFGGSLSGEFQQSEEMTEIEADLSDIDPGQLPGVVEALEMPISGALSGHVHLKLPNGKYSAAEGEIELEIADFKLADGKAKVRGLLALPQIDAGTLTMQATASEGRIELAEFQTQGPDLEAQAEGKIRLRDKLELSTTEQLTLSFKFSDKYRDKDDNTRSLLGKPGDTVSGLIDLSPQSKRAKQEDGSYKWRVSGSFSRLSFAPAVATRPSSRARPGSATPSPARPAPQR